MSRFMHLVFAWLFLTASLRFADGQGSTSTVQNLGYDQIDLSTLEVAVNIPLRTAQGPLPTFVTEHETFNFIYTSHWLYEGQSIQVLPHSSEVNWQLSTGQCDVNGQVEQLQKLTNPYVQDESGSQHPLPLGWYWYPDPQGDCTNPTSQAGFTRDGTGLYVDSITGTVTEKDGVLDSRVGGKDPDGNPTNALSSTPYFTDVLSGPPLYTILGITYYDAGGTLQQINFDTSSLTLRTNWHCFTDMPATQTTLLTTITYPDGTSLGLSYEPTPGYTGDYTGRLSKLTLPTGGVVSYTYSGCPLPNGGASTSLQVTRTTPAGTWTYTAAQVAGTIGVVTTVTDPAGNNVVHTITGTGATASEVMTQTYQGGGVNCALGCGTSNLLLTKYYCYNNWNPAKYNGDTGTLPTACGNVHEPIVNNTNGFVPTEVDVYTVVPGSSGPSEIASSYNSVGNVTRIAKYDFGAASPTTIENVSYGSYSAGACNAIGTTAQNILDRVCEVTVSDGSHTSYDVRYTYNSTGHPTNIASWTGTAWLNYSASFNSNGAKANETLVDGTPISYGYDGAGGCNSLLPTSVTVNGMVSYSTWDCNSGAMLSATDPNGAVASVSFTTNGADPMYRLKSTTSPLGATTNFSYNSTSRYVETTMSFGTSKIDKLAFVDSLRRPFLTQAADGSEYDTVNTSWGWGTLGALKQQVAVPCTAPNGQPCPSGTPVVSTYLDGLNRFSSSVDARGGTLTRQYIGPDTLDTVSPAPVGESNKALQTEVDGLGRVKSVCQVLSTGGSSCGQTNAKNGIVTTTNYAMVSGGSYSTSARNGLTRTTNYDAAGRKVSESNPESGTTTWIYDTQSSYCGSNTKNGHLVEVVSAVGIHVCYKYDSVGRVIQLSTNPSGECRYFAYGDSAPSPPSGINVSHGLNRLVAAYTSGTCQGRSALTTDEWFSYDASGDITDVWESTPHSDGYYHTTAGYFVDQMLQSLSGIPGYTAITYGIDASGRAISAAEGTTAIISGVTYGTSENPMKISIGSQGGDTSNYQYEPTTGRMQQWTFTVGSSPKSKSGTLTWNSDGTLGTLAVQDGFNAGGAQTCNYVYDDFARMTNDGCGSFAQTYSYDSQDNLTQSGSFSWACAACYTGTQYNTTLASSVAYDADGHLLNDSINEYTWDSYGRLASTIPTGSSLKCGTSGTCFTYDAIGRMVEKAQNSTYFEMLYSPVGKTAQMSGQMSNYSYLPLPGGGTLYSTGPSGTTSRIYFHKDQSGDVPLASGVISRSPYYDRAFSPLGKIYDNFGATGQIESFGETQDYDVASGLFDSKMGERHPGQGRLIAPTGPGWNPYVP